LWRVTIFSGKTVANWRPNREKLLQHFQFSEEGIAIFSPNRQQEYVNAHFLQFLNVILDKPTLDTEQLFTDPNFKDIVHF